MSNSIYTNDKQDTNPTITETAPQKEYGGIGRLAFAVSFFALSILYFVMVLIDMSLDLLVVLAFLKKGALITVICLRLKNIGQHPLQGLLAFVPFIEIMGICYGLIVPSGYNASRTLDKPGWAVLATIFVIGVCWFLSIVN